MNTLTEKSQQVISWHERTNTLHKPGTKRVLDGHERKQLSMPPVLLHTSWALGAGLAFGRHFTISEEKKIKKCKTTGHCPTQNLVCALGYSGEKRQEVTETIMTDTSISEISTYWGRTSGLTCWACTWKWNTFTFLDLNSRSVFLCYSPLWDICALWAQFCVHILISEAAGNTNHLRCPFSDLEAQLSDLTEQLYTVHSGLFTQMTTKIVFFNSLTPTDF